jgi:hydroxyacylglutathione hydrolase
MIHETLRVGLLQCNCSIFGDEQSREAIVIDPGDNIEDVLAVLREHSLRVTAIVITHAHIDHIGGAAKLKAATGAPVLLNAQDQELYDHLDMQEIDAPLTDDQVLKLGPAEFRVLHTPGHTQGSVSLWIPSENKLIAGDTLFRDSIGRTDLPGGNARQILRSIDDKLLTLPEETIVVPGHGGNTTIGREKERNPFLQGL